MKLIESNRLHGNEPLTVDQLREVPHGEIKDGTLQNICDRANEIASSRAYIDREAWKPCENCFSCGNCSEAGTDIDDYPCAECISDHEPNGLLQASMRHFHPVGFCRSCGRPLTPDAWADLKKLLRVDKV